MRILLVEDEDRVASFIEKGLGAEGHSVERAATVSDGIALATTFEFDIILLDRMLPDGDGRTVLEQIRAGSDSTPVIILSALGETDEKVELLDLGADDYLVKPFAFAELAARIRANARHEQHSSRVLSVGDLSLDTRSRVARRGNVTIDLPSREYALLDYLLRHPNQVLSRQQLLDAVWGFDFDTGSNVVDVYIGYLRRKLDDGHDESFVETIRGAGYRVRT